MAMCSNATEMGLNEQYSNKESPNNDISDVALSTNTVADQILVEGPRCFVCDVKVHGRHYALATCRTQSSRARVIEKLGELVGERYMVVISEDDVICRGCANLMNTLDRLESEMRGVRDVILRFLERKYSLDDGELLSNSEAVKPCQPPQITKSQVQNSSSYHDRKRAAVSASHVSFDGTKQKKSNIWMQCDKCRYTTRYNAFMVHHIRQHIKQRTNCDKCGVQLTPQQTIHLCKEDGYKIENIVTHETEDNAKESKSVETFPEVTMAPLNGYKEENMSIEALQSDLQIENEPRHDNVQLIRLPSPDELELQSMVVEGNETKLDHDVYVQVLQRVEIDVEPPQVSVESDTGSDMMVRVKESSGKQMLTLAEDGSLEMVEVACWDDVHSSHPDPDIPF